MGTSVRDVVYDHLRRKGIPESEIPAQFDDVVKALNESFGGSARVIIYKTLVELYRQYSMRVDFTYQDSLRDHLSMFCLLYTSPSPRDLSTSRMPSSA